jgi:Ni/Co efflux regulator RcnB
MKKFMLGVATVATLAWTTAATAQPYGYYSRDSGRDYYGERQGYRDSDNDGTPDRVERGRDIDCDGRPDQYDRYWNRGLCDRYDRGRQHSRYHLYGPGYGYDGYRGSWRVGQRYPYYRSDRYVISDYRYYGLPAPRHGYRYYRTDNGDIVMVALATGLIGLIAGQALSDNDHDHRYYR